MSTYFSDFFQIEPEALAKHGAFNVSLVTDLPLFIDPFLLFNSKKKHYRALHEEIIRYLHFLREKAQEGDLDPALVSAWYRFPEVKQTWLGFTKNGNRGSGLGNEFAMSLRDNLHNLFPDFGKESITKSSHLEKLCLVRDGVGRDNISDFTTNLIHGFLCQYTQDFAEMHLRPDQCRPETVRKTHFNYETESWESQEYLLPQGDGDYVLLTPKDILTKDDTWINRTDLVKEFERIPEAIPNDQLRAQINNYFRKVLARPKGTEPTKKDRAEAAIRTIYKYPEVIDHYIRYKEDNGDKAESASAGKVKASEALYISQIQSFQNLLSSLTLFYKKNGDTYEEAHERVAYLKHCIEDRGGWKVFYVNGRTVERESDLHVMFNLTWYGSPSDVSAEVNDGRGPADFKISKGAKDKTIVEFKLAKNTHLKRNLEKQVPAYKKASGAKDGIVVILYFDDGQLKRVNKILKDLGLVGHKDIVLIDAQRDNKPSGSKA